MQRSKPFGHAVVASSKTCYNAFFFAPEPENTILAPWGTPLGGPQFQLTPQGGNQVDQQIFLKEGSNKTNQQQRATLLFNLRYEGEFHRKVHWTHKITPIHENELYN